MLLEVRGTGATSTRENRILHSMGLRFGVREHGCVQSRRRMNDDTPEKDQIGMNLIVCSLRF